jgi:hypothetical protein
MPPEDSVGQSDWMVRAAIATGLVVNDEGAPPGVLTPRLVAVMKQLARKRLWGKLQTLYVPAGAVVRTPDGTLVAAEGSKVLGVELKSFAPGAKACYFSHGLVLPQHDYDIVVGVTPNGGCLLGSF